jgi:hypothetical protein
MAPEIISCWDFHLREELGLLCFLQNTLVSSSTSSKNGEACRHQNIIDWDSFVKGLISDKWKVAQRKYIRHHRDTPKCAESCWEYICTKAILDVGLGVWKGQKESIHGKSVKEARELSREALEAKVRVHATPPVLLRKYPAVHETSLLNRL